MQMLRATCAKGCGDFDVVAIPMPATEACKAMLARNVCPFCGHAKGHTVATPRPLTEAEAAQKRVSMEKGGR